MSNLRCSTLAAVAFLAASLTCVTARAGEPPHGPTEQKQAIAEIRNIGTAMLAWLVDHESPSGEGSREADKGTIDVSAVPVISHADLATLLVPLYMVVLPVNDPWGHPYEYRLHRDKLGSVPVMAIRSAGKDGKLSGPVYEVKSFPIDHLDQDLVWVDGYFARWPEEKN